MTIESLRNKGHIILETISGSRAYGLETPQSDTDIRGVYILPGEDFFGLNYTDLVSNESHDIAFYELGKFFKLLAGNNPNILELLFAPVESILYRDPIMNRINPEIFLSKLCEQTFGNYALNQISRARGLNKKILNPVSKERKSILDFCYVVQGQGSVPLKEFLTVHGYKQDKCGLARIPHMHEMYGLYCSNQGNYNGIIQKETANDVSLSSIPKGEAPLAIMSFNKSAYSSYCKEYKEYWEWVEKRNEVRYENTLAHGKNYDAKNMMHTFRLLAMAKEIGEEGKVKVRRPDRDFLLRVRQGEFEYDYLVRLAEEKLQEIKAVFDKSSLPETPDIKLIEKMLVDIRVEFYMGTK